MSLPERPSITGVAEALGIDPQHLTCYGRDKAKVGLGALGGEVRGEGRLVLVSSVTPSNHGEGKTTVSIGLAMALCRLGRRATVCLREPSLGPVFGVKGGGTGGGRSTVEPSADINLHFTGDLHAVSSAHNLLAALADNALEFGTVDLDARRVYWSRVVDMNDRALRNVIVGLGGPELGLPRESRFDITAASEVMAALSLAVSHEDLRERLDRIVVGRSRSGDLVCARDLRAGGAMHALLRHALEPNLVQTCGGTPAIVHGGPFANIAHGCSSVLGTRLAMHYSDDVVSEAGFGFDLGGEKFLHIKCPVAGIWPRAVVLVVTVRTLVEHGMEDAASPMGALERGLGQLDRQTANVRAFDLEPIVAINVMRSDDDAMLERVETHAKNLGCAVARVTAFQDGGEGALPLAREVLRSLDASHQRSPAPRALYTPGASLLEKVRAVGQTLYGARDVRLEPAALRDIGRFEKAGYGHLPVCIAKTHRSLSSDPKAGGLARGFDLSVRAVRLSAGAGFFVPLLGDISTMPGLPRRPAAENIRMGPDGEIHGLSPSEDE